MATTKPRLRRCACFAGVLAALCALGVGRAQADGQVTLTEAYSLEVAVFNSTPAMPYAEAVSREAAIYNSEPPVAYTQAYSREASLYNSEPALVYAQAFSREAVAYVSDNPIVDSFSRETVVFNGYYVPEGMDALRIAAGLQKSTPTQMERFQMALQMASEDRISLTVAANILRIAMRLQ